jgi:hypothetical protein
MKLALLYFVRVKGRVSDFPFRFEVVVICSKHHRFIRSNGSKELLNKDLARDLARHPISILRKMEPELVNSLFYNDDACFLLLAAD